MSCSSWTPWSGKALQTGRTRRLRSAPWPLSGVWAPSWRMASRQTWFEALPVPVPGLRFGLSRRCRLRHWRQQRRRRRREKSRGNCRRGGCRGVRCGGHVGCRRQGRGSGHGQREESASRWAFSWSAKGRCGGVVLEKRGRRQAGAEPRYRWWGRHRGCAAWRGARGAWDHCRRSGKNRGRNGCLPERARWNARWCPKGIRRRSAGWWLRWRRRQRARRRRLRPAGSRSRHRKRQQHRQQR